MSKKIPIIVPEGWNVERSTQVGQVFVAFEVALIGDQPGESATQFRFGLNPHDALALARKLQDHSVQPLLLLVGY